LGEHFGGRKPPLSYYGGKQRMAHRIIPLIPRHTVYCEPFAGGAAVFFGKPWPDVTNNNHYREVLNDHDERIVNFYRQLRNHGEELTRRLSLTPYSEAEYQVSKQLDHDDPMEAAVRYFVNGQQSFANKLNAGWGRAVYSCNWGATWANSVARVPEYLDRMAGVHLACADALKVIKDWDSPQTFFYCDPPYPGTDCGHYKGYSVDDLQRLVDALDACQGSFILSNYDQPNVTFPSDWERIEFKSKMFASRDKSAPKERIEVVWRRMAREEPRAEIKALYASGRYDCFKGDQQGLF
jgi:DNA adenine methylase